MKIVKNIILTSVVLTTLASCDMDKYPYDSIPVDNAIQSVSDCEKLRAGMYRDLRIISQSTNSLASDFQADEFIPAEYFGNQFGSLTVGKQLHLKDHSAQCGEIVIRLLPNATY